MKGKIKIETDENIEQYIEDGTTILSGFKYFLEDGKTNVIRLAFLKVPAERLLLNNFCVIRAEAERV